MNSSQDCADGIGIVYNIQRYCIHDGPGIRTTIFLYGCNLRCKWCCNPESFANNNEKKEYYDTNRLMEVVLLDRDYYQKSGGGITFSGGEPLLQVKFVAEFFKLCKSKGIGTAVETSGQVPREALESISGLVDYYLYDIKSIDSDVHLNSTGVDNQLILDNLFYLAENGANIILRLPLVDGYNMESDDAKQVGELIGKINAYEVNLLPYHGLGKAKYKTLGMVYGLEDMPDHLADKDYRKKVEIYCEIIKGYTNKVFIGG